VVVTQLARVFAGRLGSNKYTQNFGAEPDFEKINQGTMNIRKRLRVGIPAAVLTIICILAVAPWLFKGRLIAKTKEAINAHLNATVDFRGVSLSLFRDFPNFSLRLSDLSVTGTGTFEGVTLLKTPAITIEVDLKSALRPKMPLIIHGIHIRTPELRLLTTAGGVANYLILKPGAGEAPAETLAPDSARIVATIEAFSFTDGDIWYEDASQGLKIHLQGVSHNSSGDVTAAVYALKTSTRIERLTLNYGGVTFLNAARANLDAGFRVNQSTETYTFLDNKLKINDLSLECEGALRFLERGYAMDFRLRGPENDFKDFFSIIPGAYLQGYEDVQAEGKFDFDASLNGVYDDSLGRFPAYDIGMEIINGKVRYPSLPLGISGVNAKLRLHNPASDPDSLRVEVPALALRIGNNPIRAAFHLSTPVSDPKVDGHVRGSLDLGELSRAFPIPDMKGLRGKISADISAKASMSQLDRKQYEAVEMRGFLKAKDIVYPSKDLPEVRISALSMAFTPRAAQIDPFDLQIGKSDFAGNAQIDNILAYFSPQATMRGRLFLRSARIDANQLLPQGDEASVSASGAARVQAPLATPPFDRFDFSLDAAAKQVLYDRFDLREAAAKGRAIPNRLTLETLSGKIGGSDLKASGMITGAFDYLFYNGILGGSIALESETLDLNQFLEPVPPTVKTTATGTKTTDPAPAFEGFLQVPERMALKLTVRARLLRYTNYEIKNLSGSMEIAERSAALSNIQGDVFGGRMKFNGQYETPPAKNPAFKAKLELDKMDFGESFRGIATFQSLAPIGKFISGTLNSSLILEGPLGEGMMPVLGDLTAKGFLQTLNASIKGYLPLKSLGSALNLSELKEDIRITDTKNWFEVKQGRVEVKPFEFAVGEYRFTIAGTHSLQQQMDYDIKTRIPWSKLGPVAQGASGAVPGQIREQAARLGINLQTGDYFDLLIHLSGNIREPKFSYKVLSPSNGNTLEKTIAGEAERRLENTLKTLEKKAEGEISRFDSQARAKGREVTDSLSKKVQEALERQKAEGLEKARETLEKQGDKALSDSLQKALQRQAEKVLDPKKSKEEADKLKKELEKFNPFKKKNPQDTTARKTN
jgi:hypothetical protein